MDASNPGAFWRTPTKVTSNESNGGNDRAARHSLPRSKRWHREHRHRPHQAGIQSRARPSAADPAASNPGRTILAAADSPREVERFGSDEEVGPADRRPQASSSTRTSTSGREDRGGAATCAHHVRRDAPHRAKSAFRDGRQARRCASGSWHCCPTARECHRYGLSPGRADPTTKAVRKGRALTGLEVDWRTGHAEPGERSQSHQSAGCSLPAVRNGRRAEARGHQGVRSGGLATFLIQSVTGNGSR